MTETTELSRCATIAKEKDSDRFTIAMLAPADKREALFALIAFNHEIAKTGDTVSEPMLGQIRLQWWRESIDECFQDQPRRHEVVIPLHQAIRNHDLPEELFSSLIDKRECDLDNAGFANEEALLQYARATGGNLSELMTVVLAGDCEKSRRAAGHIGTAWALIGLMRALPFHLRRHWVSIPETLQAKHGIEGKDLAKGEGSSVVSAAVGDVCTLALQELHLARELRRDCRKEALPALRLASLCDSYLRQLRRADNDPFSPTLAEKPALRVMGLIAKHLTGQF
ncbi:phytoene/squalene synthase family protein [Aestuariispira ectoiniformans]|uniref:phytoene/squalene synthase family protein n=1 Tax=Aestuariispira ectoiniformans TaxID=2775080 RepID=UPI00223B904C|nr:phytoene/squalene synthase family protein [Aestuariispira ectoiniformans]